MSDPRLSDFQVELANVFFSLPESAGFLLAGGGALIAQGIVPRPTEDLDFFTSRHAGSVAAASDALIAAATTRGWRHELLRTGEEFRRWAIIGPETVLVDLAVDSPAASTPTVTIAGPSFAPAELAIRKPSHCSDARSPATSLTFTCCTSDSNARKRSGRRPRPIRASISRCSRRRCGPMAASKTRTSRTSAYRSPTSGSTSTPGPTKSTRVSRPPGRTPGPGARRSAGSPARCGGCSARS